MKKSLLPLLLLSLLISCGNEIEHKQIFLPDTIDGVTYFLLSDHTKEDHFTGSWEAPLLSGKEKKKSRRPGKRAGKLKFLSLKKVGCWALTEPDSGSDAFAMRTTFRVDGNEVVIKGSKTFISNAPAADVFLIYARLDDPSRAKENGREKQRIFPLVVERGTPGLSTGPPIEKMGMHASPTGEIFLDEVRVPRSHLLGDPDRPARDAAEETLAVERTAIVAMCLGVIERCLDDSVVYAMDRVQFDKPIAAFQLIQQKLARMYVAKENVRNLMFKLIWLQKAGGASEAEVSGAKWYATEAATAVALEAVQLMGGAGYTSEHAPERLFRDMKLWTIGGGTSEIQQLTIAKDLLRQHGFKIDLGGGYQDDRRR